MESSAESLTEYAVNMLNMDLSGLSDVEMGMIEDETAAKDTSKPEKESQHKYLGVFDVHINNLIPPAPERTSRLLDLQHVKFLMDSFQSGISGQLTILVGEVQVETLGGNHTREALQCLLQRGQIKLSTVKVNLYSLLSKATALTMGWQHNVVLQEKQKPITFVDKVRVMRQVRPSTPLSAADMKAWKGLLSSIFQVKDMRRFQQSYGIHLQMAQLEQNVWDMVEESQSAVKITEKFFRPLMKLSDDKIKTCLEILKSQGLTEYNKKVNEFSPASLKKRKIEETSEMEKRIGYEDLLEQYNHMADRCSKLEKENSDLKNKLDKGAISSEYSGRCCLCADTDRLGSSDLNASQTLGQDSNTASSNLKLEPISEVDFAVFGIDFMSDGRLVTVYKNKQCILMNDKLVKIGKKYLLRAIPLGVVCMSNNEIAVALTNKTICVLVVEKDCVIREKRTFITNVQYLALRKLDDSTLVGFARDIPEHARKITMDGREEDFTTLKKRDYTSMCPEYDCRCVYIPSQNTFLTRETKNKLHIHDTDTGFNKGVQFEKEIYAVCQGSEGSAMVVCDSEVVQMTMKGVILRKCNRSGHARMVCANKSFSTLAIASLDSITLYSSTATTTWSLEPRAELAFTINGLDFLPDGRLVAVFANKTCVIMNYKLNKIGKRFLFTASPLDVVWISDNDIAVALDNMTICIISVRNDNVMQQKCSFTTQVQYHALRKLDSTTMVGFEAERARKITMDGMEKDFKSFVKTGYPSASRSYNCKYACIPCIHKLATFDQKTNVVCLQDPEKGTSKCVQFEKEIISLCQGPASTVFVVFDDEFVQMSCEGRTLNKCSYDDCASIVCANKDFSVIALSVLTDVELYKLSI